MKKRWISTTLCAAMVTDSLIGCGLKSPDVTATAPTVAEAPTETVKTEGDAVEESKTEVAGTEATADISDMSGVTLVMAEVNPLDAIVGQIDTKFRETVEGLPGGRIEIDLQTSGVFGSENDVSGTMLGGGGTIDISHIPVFTLISHGAKESVPLPIPYTFANCNHFWKFADSELALEFPMGPYDSGLGVRDLYCGGEGFRHLFTIKGAEGLDDLKDIELRVSSDPIMNGIAESLGVNPTVASFNELYSAFQTGIVDGAGRPIANYKSNAFQEVTPNLVLDGHTLGAIQVIITDEVWDKLTEEQQSILMGTGKVASQFNRTIFGGTESKVLEELKTDGINVVEVPDIESWQGTYKDVIESSTKDQTELYQQTLGMNK